MTEPATSKRLAALEKMTAGGKGDALTWYGLAMEYASLGRTDDALQAFTALRERDGAYVPTYYQAGALLKGVGRLDEARTWLVEGTARAKAKGDSHTLSEIEALLAQL